MVLSLFHGSTWSDLLCQGHCLYFATLIASIHYSQQSVVDWMKFKGYCVYWRKTIVARSCKGAYLFHWTSDSNSSLQPPHSFMITAQKWSFLRIWSHLLKKALMENFIFCAVGKRVKWTNSILLIRTCNDLQYFLWKIYILSSENNQGQGLKSRTFCGWGRRNE